MNASMHPLTALVLLIWQIGKLVQIHQNRKHRKLRAAFWKEHEERMAVIEARTAAINAERERIRGDLAPYFRK
jgi:hypothetical protein